MQEGRGVFLFLIQSKGTSWIGGLFGPVMLAWFIVVGLLGIVGIVRSPTVLAALSPMPAITYLWHGGPLAFAVVGAAFLAVTGGEAMYADMGHFGRTTVNGTTAWSGAGTAALARSTRRSVSMHSRDWRLTWRHPDYSSSANSEGDEGLPRTRAADRDVRYWHKADIAGAVRNVRYWG
jgi:hypothetical protein